MAQGTTICEVKGARQLRSTLRAAGDNLADLKETHKRAAQVAADRAAALAPRSTGRLAASIRAAGTKTAGIVRAGNNTTAPYAGPIHWGWRERNITPNTFASTGAQQSEPTWRKLYETYVDDTLNTIKGI